MIPVKIPIYIKTNIAHTAVPGLSMCHSIENDKLKAPDINYFTKNHHESFTVMAKQSHLFLNIINVIKL